MTEYDQKSEFSQRQARRRALERLHAEAARRDINEFCEFLMRDPKGRLWRQAPFHRAWHELLPLAGPVRLLIVAPRESAKSSQMVVARVLWELGRNAELRTKVICSTDDLAAKLVGEIARHILRNRRLQLVFPELRPDPEGPWTRSQLRVVREGFSKDASD